MRCCLMTGLQRTRLSPMVVRLDAMYDDFVIVGPSFDPAGTRGLNDTSKGTLPRRVHYLRSVAMTAAPIGWSFGFGDPLEPNLISRLRGTATWRKAWRKS
jgi:hypothetical protein